MTRPITHTPNPELDLVFTRIVDVPKELVWKAWTTPEQILKWFTPAPWTTTACELDLRPGGMFRTVMRSPEGQEYPNVGCYLEIVENEKLVWTNAMEPGYRPATKPPIPGDNFAFTAVISIETQGTGTRYTALVIHGNPADRKRHEDMGFHDGWGQALDQLVALVKNVKKT